MVLSTVEFAVDMTCENCVKNVRKQLEGIDGIEQVDVSLANQTVILNTSLPSFKVQRLIENSGKRAVLKGLSSSKDKGNFDFGSAVAMLAGDSGFSCGKAKGVVRFVQLDQDTCVIEGTVDGLSPGEHGLHVHECGDISKGCDSVGDHFSLADTPHGNILDDVSQRHTGDLGNIKADNDGRAEFRFEDRVLKVWDIIGRSLVVTENPDDGGRGKSPMSKINGNSGNRLACAIIARSAGLFQNNKQICACDGVTIWNERDKPLTGPGRRANNEAPISSSKEMNVCSIG